MPKSLLVIEDEAGVRESIALFFEDKGSFVYEAENGRQGLELFRQQRPDIVLVDLRMPGIDGLDVISSVKEESPDTPVIVVSGTGVLADAIEALRLGAWDYVLKPIEDMQVLEHAVNKAIERVRLIHENQAYQQNLEEQVAQRTAELQTLNQTLQKNEQRYRSLYTSISEGVALHEIIYDESDQAVDYRVIDVNPAFESILGMERNDVIGAKASEIYGTGEAPYLEIYAEVADSSEPVTFETIFERVGRSFRVTAFSPEKGRFATLFADITERRRLEEQAKQHQAELAHVSRLSTVAAMASGLAHELNQPLCAISTHASACINGLRSGPFKREDVAEDLQMITRQSQRAGKVIQQIRRFLKKRPPELTPVDMNGLVQTCLDLTSRQFDENGMSVISELSDELPTVLGDPIQLEQVILNLVQNAIDAMIDVPSAQRQLTVRTKMQSHSVLEVIVRDSGTGICEDIFEKMFDPFSTTKDEGLGVGLSISRSIIESHRGRILAASNEGQGSTFVVELPVSS